MQRLGAERAVVGLITGLFHDVGYLRRADDTDSRNGAEFTRTHVSRGARFLTDYLPAVGLAHWTPVVTEIIHFTGYEVPFARIEAKVPDPRDITLGHLLGTADMIAQMADRCYLEKCRDRLYAEFVLGGVALPFCDGNPQVKYASGLDLLRQTPDFVMDVRTKRLDREFHRAYQLPERALRRAQPLHGIDRPQRRVPAPGAAQRELAAAAPPAADLCRHGRPDEHDARPYARAYQAGLVHRLIAYP